ncbi:Wzz/FepE/Etk N-terminal domain-containing protein [Acidithiobacillus sp.]|jgi:LPS O-antigen subunit length determinant protein (WzzB/FepE family)|uniref:Wzz/FepE/Etk N-terminal domain-containing protein n=1 Tax=Acidithiobacillus sp. TaxID=1872118 RepID=UPI0025BD0884|nr:Wzz/FepE/Etk N-terminal domain-containing protein [Acidithiobacillus sp.]MCK9187969.1 Wzz/FepE/Etk N-terminal domain-containing protein [Acidithiobacillus sp.]MCK9359928.1 Wzz/FepE/Etk N-terminal domain-containing protein [Acidithiobacillus sp.]
MNNLDQERPPENGDGISLYEIYAILRQKRALIIAITTAFALLAGVYSFIRPTNYTYQACVSMGTLGRDGNGQPIFIDSPQSAMAQLDNAYIPSVVDSVLNGQKKNHFDTKQFKTSNPKDSSLVCIKTDAPKRLGDSVSQIQNASLQRVVSNNARIAAVPNASAEAHLSQLQATAQTLSTKIANVLDQERAVNSELALLKTKDTVLQSQGARMAQEIDRMRPLVKKGIHNIHNDSTALTMMIQNNQVAQERQQLFKVEMERSVALPKEQIALLNTMKTLKREVNDLNAKVAANSAQMGLAQASLKALQITHIVRSSSPSIDPVGPGKAVFIVLGALMGLMLSVFYALLAYAVASRKASAPPAASG